MPTELTSVRAIVDAIGGSTATARLIGVTPGAVCQWMTADLLPTGRIPAVKHALAKRGVKVDDLVLWSLTRVAYHGQTPTRAA